MTNYVVLLVAVASCSTMLYCMYTNRQTHADISAGINIVCIIILILGG